MKTSARSLASARSRIAPTFEVEARAIAGGDDPVTGIDEAGRGPWAGPVVAAAVILDPQALPAGIDDSKALAAGAREALFEAIMTSARGVGIGIASVERIDNMNILRATFWAMAQAVAGLPSKPRLALVDGKLLPKLPCAARAIVGGDATSLSIAAASIIAKVTRDRIMVEIARSHPGYGFERHKGYGTPEHKTALAALGVCAHHRRSFQPVKDALGGG